MKSFFYIQDWRGGYKRKSGDIERIDGFVYGTCRNPDYHSYYDSEVWRFAAYELTTGLMVGYGETPTAALKSIDAEKVARYMYSKFSVSHKNNIAELMHRMKK